ncbi:MAG: trypsin-like peptidase domain-containing protein [Acidimicrobiales bacterium]|jgi:S1-C subfamily serine protease
MTIFTMAVVAGVVFAAVAGILVGHVLWRNTSATSGGLPSASSPFGNSGGSFNPFGSGNSGSGNSGSGNSGSGQGSSNSGGPADAGSIANNVDPGLVDINTSINNNSNYTSLQGAGTGMVLTPTGEVLTNNHVVEGATKISVTDVGSGKTYNASVVGYDRSQDVAVLQLVDASGLQTVNLGDSSKVSVGEGVVGIGNANGAGGTPSYAGGSVTATDQSITASDDVDGTSEQVNGLIETNANIIAGDSGGPLVNSSGQVVGMDTAGSQGFQFQSPGAQGYAIPVNQVLSTAKEIKAGSASSTVHIGQTAFLGVEVDSSGGGGFGSGGSGGSGGLGNGNGSGSSTSGAYVANVVAGGPAAQAGLAPGDTITSVDGYSVTSPDSLTNVMLIEKPDASVPVQYVDSSGQQQTTTVKLGTGPPQ